ncbi:MAG: hypothetical protein JKX91_03215 [Rhizobiaceae bacterium]|nr:hypothetical protein [Rhizobiaceae bacterium]
MAEIERFSPIQYIDTFTDIAASLGMHLSSGTDFQEFLELSVKQPLKPHVNPAFDPECTDISPKNGFWIVGHDDSGEIIHSQAIKLLDMSGGDLAEHFQDYLADFRSYGYNFDLDECHSYLTPAASKISGRVSYHGELWIKGGPNGYRGGCLATILTRLMMTMSLHRWSPDYMIGLQSPMTSCRGLAVREGYMHVEQRSIVWQRSDSPEALEDWLVWMSKEEAKFNLRVQPEIFYEMFETRKDRPSRVVKRKQKIA